MKNECYRFFSILILIGVFLWLVATITASVQGGVCGFIAELFGGGIFFLVKMALAYIIRAFLMIYANTSTLYEINLKHQ